MEPTDIKFSKSDQKNKKYRVEFKLKGKKFVRHFGDIRYEQYRDSTPLFLYAHLNHLDSKRRAAYYKRHGRTNNAMSSKYWANRYLW